MIRSLLDMDRALKERLGSRVVFEKDFGGEQKIGMGFYNNRAILPPPGNS